MVKLYHYIQDTIANLEFVKKIFSNNEMKYYIPIINNSTKPLLNEIKQLAESNHRLLYIVNYNLSNSQYIKNAKKDNQDLKEDDLLLICTKENYYYLRDEIQSCKNNAILYEPLLAAESQLNTIPSTTNYDDFLLLALGYLNKKYSNTLCLNTNINKLGKDIPIYYFRNGEIKYSQTRYYNQDLNKIKKEYNLNIKSTNFEDARNEIIENNIKIIYNLLNS